MTVQTAAHRTSFGPSRQAVSLFGAVTAASIFVAAGLVLIGLAAAFPLALSAVEQNRLQVPAADLALAERIAPLWWIFVVAAVANFAAGFSAPDGRMAAKAIAVVVAGIGAAVAGGGGAVLQLSAEVAIVAAVLTGLYVVALLGAVLVQRHDA
jgi:hypothetical protein